MMRQKSVMRNYYSSWEDLLEKSEIADRSNLLRRHHYGSTESINTSGSEGSKQQAVFASQKQKEQELFIQAAEKQPNLKQTSFPMKPDLDDNKLYGKSQSAPAVKKSNSRVCSSGKLCLRVESFSDKKSNNGCETVRNSSTDEPAAQYVGLYQKSTARHDMSGENSFKQF
jgi:hypothetical protein